MITTVEKYKNPLSILFILVVSICFMGVLSVWGEEMENSLDNLVLSENEMGNYELKQERVAHFPVGENMIKHGIQQKWRTPEGEELFYQIISFPLNKKASRGAAYYATHMATPFTKGSFSGITLGDTCWRARDLGLALLTVKGKFVIFVGKIVYKEGDERTLEEITGKILLKIGDVTSTNQSIK